MHSGARRAGRSTGAVIRTVLVYFLTATGLIVWAVQLAELGMFYYFPQRYQEIMAHELEEEQRRDKFYGIDPSLPDEEYFKELGAKDEALGNLTSRLQSQSNLATILEDKSQAAGQGLGDRQVQGTYLNSLNDNRTARGLETSGDGAEWRPRFFLELNGTGELGV